MSEIYEFNPDYATHPGEILEEVLDTRHISKTEFAQRCGVSLKKISEIIHKKSSLTPESAIQFESVLGIPAKTWNNLNANYHLYLAIQKRKKQKEKLIEWVKNFSLKILKEKNILSDIHNKEELGIELLKFFGVANLSAWKKMYKNPLAYYRKAVAHKQSIYNLSVWLRLVEIQASQMDVEVYNERKFRKILKELRGWTLKSNLVFSDIAKKCKETGVVFIIEKELPKIRLYGATRWISNNKVVLSLTLRQKTNDQFWFSFFHEAGHILQHEKKKYFMDIEKLSEDRLEIEANQFSRNLLIPENEYHNFVHKKQFSKKDIQEFAKKMNIHPGIVVGFLQHDTFISYNWYNTLKDKIYIEND